MPLVVEDGTGVANASSYVSEADIIAYALARGVTIPDDGTATLAGIKAMDYLEIQSFHGSQTLPGVQELQWPRTPLPSLFIGCFLPGPTQIGPNEIPKNLKLAECELALQSFNGIDLLPNIASQQFVKSEKVGGNAAGVEVEYLGPPSLAAIMPRVEALLRPLLNVGFNNIRVTRA